MITDEQIEQLTDAFSLMALPEADKLLASALTELKTLRRETEILREIEKVARKKAWRSIFAIPNGYECIFCGASDRFYFDPNSDWEKFAMYHNPSCALSNQQEGKI